MINFGFIVFMLNVLICTFNISSAQISSLHTINIPVTRAQYALHKDTIYVFNAPDVMQRYDLNGNKIDVKYLKYSPFFPDSGKFIEEYFRDIQVRSFYKDFIIMHGYRTAFFSWSGDFLYSQLATGPGYKPWEESFNGYFFGAYKGTPIYSPKTNTVIEAVQPNSTDSINRYTNSYQFSKKELADIYIDKHINHSYMDPSLPLLVKYSIEPNLNLKANPEEKYNTINTSIEGYFDHIDTLYLKNAVADKYFCESVCRKAQLCLNPLQEMIYVNQVMTPRIDIFDARTMEKTGEFGKEGRHYYGDSDTLVYFTENEIRQYYREDSVYLRASVYLNGVARFLVQHYQGMYFDTLNSYIYRTYTSGVPGETKQTMSRYSRKPFKILDENAGRRSTYLQIYDAADGYKLIYDEPVPAPFHIIGTDEKGFLWAVTGWNEDGVELSKYKIER